MALQLGGQIYLCESSSPLRIFRVAIVVIKEVILVVISKISSGYNMQESRSANLSLPIMQTPKTESAVS